MFNFLAGQFIHKAVRSAYMAYPLELFTRKSIIYTRFSVNKINCAFIQVLYILIFKICTFIRLIIQIAFETSHFFFVLFDKIDRVSHA